MVFGYFIQGKTTGRFILFGMFSFDCRRERNTSIHPDNRQDVEFLRGQTQPNTQAPIRHVGRPRQDTCPICLNDPSVLSVETNCGHLFCGSLRLSFPGRKIFELICLGKCIITFWKYQSNWMSGMKCPVCRQSVCVDRGILAGR